MKIFEMLNKHKYLIFLLILMIPGIFPLTKYGLPPTHDGEYHVIRFHQFYKVLSDGVIYPRWASNLNNGFGIPLFNYVYPFPNYFASVLHFFGFSFIDSFKLNMLLATVSGCLFFYYWTKSFFGPFGGLVAAVFYAYAPYRFVDIYVRGSVGELWALAFLPALMWVLTTLKKHKSTNMVILGGIIYSLIIFSHNILAVMITIYALTYCTFLNISEYKIKKKLINSYFLVFLIGISLTAIFWLPALVEKEFVRGLEIYNPTDNFAELYEIIIPSWGSGFSNDGIYNRMSLQVGFIPLIVVLMSYAFILNKFNKIKEFRYIVFHLVWFNLVFFLMLKISAPVWENIKVLHYFQFPWRFLSISIVCSSFLAGAVTSVFKSKMEIYVGLLLIFFMILTTYNYTKPAYYHQRTDNYYISRSNFIHGTNSPGNLFNTKWFGNPENIKTNLRFINNKGIFKELINKTNYKKYQITTKAAGSVQAKLAYFPGWRVFEDGKEVISNKDKNGLLVFRVSEGQHIIEVIFTDTILRRIAYLWTITTLMVLMLFFIKNNKLQKI